jgi:hypothetical protein
VPNTETSSYTPIQQMKIADRQYDLITRACSKCGTAHYEIWRWAGVLFARYKMPDDFAPDDFQQFVEGLDEQLFESSHDIMQEFHDALFTVNSPDGIEADYSFAFQLLEYGRQRAITLKRLSYLDALISEDAPTESDCKAVRAAFELGFAAAQHRMMVSYEDYVHDGIAMSEWREAGLPKARQERLRRGATTRAEILKAAQKLYQHDPALVRNDSETARRILKLHLPALQKGGHQQVGFDSITRHLREGRRDQKLQEN